MQPTERHNERGPTLWEMMGPMGRGLRSAGHDIWQIGIMQGTRDIRVFLAHPPRWFLVAVGVCVACVILFFACAFSGAVASQARYLRDLMP